MAEIVQTSAEEQRLHDLAQELALGALIQGGRPLRVRVARQQQSDPPAGVQLALSTGLMTTWRRRGSWNKVMLRVDLGSAPGPATARAVDTLSDLRTKWKWLDPTERFARVRRTIQAVAPSIIVRIWDVAKDPNADQSGNLERYQELNYAPPSGSRVLGKSDACPAASTGRSL